MYENPTILFLCCCTLHTVAVKKKWRDLSDQYSKGTCSEKERNKEYAVVQVWKPLSLQRFLEPPCSEEDNKITYEFQTYSHVSSSVWKQQCYRFTACHTVWDGPNKVLVTIYVRHVGLCDECLVNNVNRKYLSALLSCFENSEEKKTRFALAVTLFSYIHTVHANSVSSCICAWVLIWTVGWFVDVNACHGCQLPSGTAQNCTV